MRPLVWLVVLLVGSILLYAERGLPRLGDVHAPPARHISPRYIERSHVETGTPNFVTAILADYRSYDTLGETTVIFTAGLACVLILWVQIQRP